MSHFHLKSHSFNLLLRSSYIVALLGVIYSLQRLAESGRPGVAQVVARTEQMTRKGRAASNQAVSDRAVSSQAVSSQVASSQIDLSALTAPLQVGDIIFCSDGSWPARVVERFAGGDRYSRVGIITRDGGQLRVVYAAAKARESIHGSIKIGATEIGATEIGWEVVEASLTDFLEKGNTTRAAVYRLKTLSPAARAALATAARARAKSPRPADTRFEAYFDLAVSPRVSGSGLIRQLYWEAAGIDLAEAGLGPFAVPLAAERVTPDSLLTNGRLEQVHEFHQVQSVLLPSP